MLLWAGDLRKSVISSAGRCISWNRVIRTFSNLVSAQERVTALDTLSANC
jgi:hypothetical protein